MGVLLDYAHALCTRACAQGVTVVSTLQQGGFPLSPSSEAGASSCMLCWYGSLHIRLITVGVSLMLCMPHCMSRTVCLVLYDTRLTDAGVSFMLSMTSPDSVDPFAMRCKDRSAAR